MHRPDDDDLGLVFMVIVAFLIVLVAILATATAPRFVPPCGRVHGATCFRGETGS